MLNGLAGVCQSPTGSAYNVFAGTPLMTEDIAGKTGTAQVTGTNDVTGQPNQDTSVFTSFAPATNPTYEVTAFMQEAGYGATIAGPVVRQIYDDLYHQAPEPVTYIAPRGAQT